jgi:hypothetical protein
MSKLSFATTTCECLTQATMVGRQAAIKFLSNLKFFLA